MSRAARIVPWVVSFGVATTASSTAGASDLESVTVRTIREWSEAGAQVVRMPPRFLFDEAGVVVTLPAAAEHDAVCTHVAVVGTRGLSFRARFSDATNDPLDADQGGRASSVAGIVELKRCDGARAPRHVRISSESGRGTVEVVVAYAAPGLSSLASVVPERTGGALPKPPQAGLLPAQIAPEKRAEAAEVRAKRDGASSSARVLLPVFDDGNGEEEIELSPGCHRVELFPLDPREKHPSLLLRLDLDAELRDAESDQLLARDRTESPNARLETCLGEAGRVRVVFVGALPRSKVVTTVATWPLPRRLPSVWGASTKAKMARAAFERHLPSFRDEPIFLGQGGSGKTPFALPIEPGGCYVAMVGTTHGRVQGLQLRATVGAETSSNERGAEDEAAAVAFCAHGKDKARVEVQARGPGLGFGLAVYRLASGMWEDAR